jgi:DNA-binding response OmpR family regulator
MAAARILVVEDDSAIGIALEDDLRYEGYDVDLVSDGGAAVARARAAAYDLILLDVMLPGIDGFEVCRQLRRSGITARILLLTARGGESDRILGLDLGGDDYVTKPYSPRELRARIRAHLRSRPSAAGPAVTRFGDCELDPVRGELRRQGAPVPVTPLEFKLLTLFASRPGRVLTRRVLIDEAWGAATSITERVVDNQIANLRKKIEREPAAPRFLKSVRGIGYRFDLENVTES